MPSQSWTVDFDGPSRHIVADLDPQTGRVAIRVDGRMVAKPMAADEDERAFAVGTVTYVVRRTAGGELDLDIAPAHLQPPPAPAAQNKTPPEEKPKPVPVFRIVASIVVTLVLGAAVRYGRHVITYMRVPWRSYTAPDRMFRVNFAGVPLQSRFTVDSPAGALPAVQLRSQYARHLYIVEVIHLPGVVPAGEDVRLTQDVLDGIVERLGWKVLQREWGHRGLGFIAEVPPSEEWSRGTARGSVITHGDRVYIVYAFVPRGESLSWDVGEFLRSLELAE